MLGLISSIGPTANIKVMLMKTENLVVTVSGRNHMLETKTYYTGLRALHTSGMDTSTV